MADVNIPKIGPIKKPVVIAIGVGAVALIGWRYYQSRSGTGADVTATGDYVDPGTIPAVSGATSGTNSYGSGAAADNSTTSYGFTGTTNDQWSQYAATQLSQSAEWSYTDIVTALGNFLTNKPLTTLQQQIVQAAIAVAGYPPQGSHTVIPGGNAPITVAPTGVTAKALSPTAIELHWSPVAGAAGYHLYMPGSGLIVGESVGTTGIVGNLIPSKSYSLQVAAHTGSGQTGPRSSIVHATTLAPVKPTVTKPITAIKR